MALLLVRLMFQGVPDVVRAYEMMPHAILQADFFRYLILFARGGVYADLDTIALQSVGYWMDKIGAARREHFGLMIGVEADAVGNLGWQQWYAREMQLCQWTIVAKPGHPALATMIASVTADTLRGAGHSAAKGISVPRCLSSPGRHDGRI